MADLDKKLSLDVWMVLQMLSSSYFMEWVALESYAHVQHIFLLGLCRYLSLIGVPQMLLFPIILPIFIFLLRQFQLRHITKDQ